MFKERPELAQALFEPRNVQILHNHQILHDHTDFKFLCGNKIAKYGSVKIAGPERGGVRVVGQKLTASLSPKITN